MPWGPSRATRRSGGLAEAKDRMPKMRGVVAVLGATGYTGRLVAAELARRDRPYRLGARDPRRLAEVPHVSHGEVFVVDVTDPSGLDKFLDGADVLVNTVGPFSALGLPVVEAAVRKRVAYVDSTGEPGFMAEVYRRFAQAPIPLVPACAFDYIPGDLAADIAASDLGGTVDEVGVHYDISSMQPSRGTARSALGVLAQEPFALKRWRVTFPDRAHDAIEWPGGERVTVPRHVPGARVTVTMAVPVPLLPGWEFGAAALAWLSPFLRPLVELLPEGPTPAVRAAARYRVLAEATGPAGRAAVLCEGSDTYGVSARFLVEAAERLRGRGAMAPAEALEPAAFLDAVSGEDFRWRRVEAGTLR
jgi:Saccharopine dehydrogenase NADP binding domain